jgi:hypothetical protein
MPKLSIAIYSFFIVFVGNFYSSKTSKLMKIKDIKVGMSNVNVEASVVDKSESRSVQTKYGRR